MTEQLPFHFSFSCIGEGNGNPLQCSCLENPRDGGAWWAPIYGVTQSRTWLKWLSSSSSKHTKTNLLAAISEGFKGVSWYGWKPDWDNVYNSLVLKHITYILFSCLSLLDFFLFRQVEDPKLIQPCMVLVQVIPLSGSISVPRESTLRGPGWATFLLSCSLMYSLSHGG